MTPEAVIFRYLEILRTSPMDADGLQRLLCLDADLLGRWLTSLGCAAEPAALRDAIEARTAEELAVLARSHAWAMLPTIGTARLAMDQWQSVCTGAHLAETLAAHLLQLGWESASVADPLRVRMQILLAISGVILRHDEALVELAEFRGTPVHLLIDADPLPQIFAIVEALETEGTDAAAEIAETLLDIPPSRFATLRGKAEAACGSALSALALAGDDSVEWGERLWVNERVAMLASLLPGTIDETASFDQVHAQICRALFGCVPELLLPDGDDHWRALLDASIRLRRNSPVSRIAQAGRDAASRLVEDSAELAVADRQVLRRLRASEALIVPVLDAVEPVTLMILVFPADDELEPDFAMRAYADALARWYRAREATVDDGAPGEELARFRAAEQRRLRELVHEANNPLSIVHNYLHILELRMQDEPTAREQLSMIGSELRRAADIIQRMKDVPDTTEPAADQDVPVQPRSFDLNGLVRQVCELSEGSAARREVEIERWLSLGELDVVSDPDLLTQVLTNLLKNAIEACSAGDTVSLSTHGSVVRDGRPGVEVTVQDSGPGLPSEVLANLRAAKTSAKGGQHEGLGLHLVYRLMTALGGQLDVRTSPETGTEFSLFLPANEASG